MDDFLSMGVANVWMVGPWKRTAYVSTPLKFEQPADGFLRVPGTSIAISLAEIFAELDENC